MALVFYMKGSWTVIVVNSTVYYLSSILNYVVESWSWKVNLKYLTINFILYLEIFQKKNVFLVEGNPLCQPKTSALERGQLRTAGWRKDSCKDGPGGGGAGLHSQDTGGGGTRHEGAPQYVYTVQLPFLALFQAVLRIRIRMFFWDSRIRIQ